MTSHFLHMTLIPQETYHTTEQLSKQLHYSVSDRYCHVHLAELLEVIYIIAAFMKFWSHCIWARFFMCISSRFDFLRG